MSDQTPTPMTSTSADAPTSEAQLALAAVCLRKLEWDPGDDGFIQYCRVCGGRNRHNEHCPLDAVLRNNPTPTTSMSFTVWAISIGAPVRVAYHKYEPPVDQTGFFYASIDCANLCGYGGTEAAAIENLCQGVTRAGYVVVDGTVHIVPHFPKESPHALRSPPSPFDDPF